MANIFEAQKTMTELMRMYEVDDWGFAFNNCKTSLGSCNYKKRRLELSRHYVQLNSVDYMLDTMLHEIAHLLAYKKYGYRVKHDYRWVEIAKAIGCIGERTACNKSVVRPKGKYVYKCSKCGYEIAVHRRFKRRKACSDCCIKYGNGKFDERFEMRLQLKWDLSKRGQSTVEYLLLLTSVIYLLTSAVSRVAKAYTNSIEKQLKEASSTVSGSIGCTHKKKGKHKKHKQH